jgi:hypothetical protein
MEDGSVIVIVMVIEGHDWRYSGDGWKWTDDGDGWDRLKRTGYTSKECMTCGTIALPSESVRPCHEIWSAKYGLPAVDKPTRKEEA